MDISRGSDKFILREMGARLKRKRIEVNLSQMALAKKSGISRRTVQAIEKGDSISLDKLIAILRSLDSLDGLDSFLPKSEISPLQIAKNKGYERQRAYQKSSSVHDESGEYEW